MRSVVLVAGYGTSVKVPGEYEELTRVLLREAQRRGRALDPRFRPECGREDSEGARVPMRVTQDYAGVVSRLLRDYTP